MPAARHIQSIDGNQRRRRQRGRAIDEEEQGFAWMPEGDPARWNSMSSENEPSEDQERNHSVVQSEQQHEFLATRRSRQIGITAVTCDGYDVGALETCDGGEAKTKQEKIESSWQAAMRIDAKLRVPKAPLPVMPMDVLMGFDTSVAVAFMNETAHQALVLTDARGTILRVNGPWIALCGFTEAEVAGRTSKILQGQNTSTTQVAAFDACIKARERAEMTITNYTKEKTPFQNHVIAVPTSQAQQVSPLLAPLTFIAQLEIATPGHASVSDDGEVKIGDVREASALA